MQRTKQIIKNTPVLGSMAKAIYRTWINPPTPFMGSETYWIARYDRGGNSGDGSYNQLAEFKAEILNQFVQQHHVKSVIEFGCGDGNQLLLADYPTYIGYDISPKAVSMCREAFKNDPTKVFKLLSDYNNETGELTLSLDVVYHLIEDDVFSDYMHRLFDSSTRFVIVYASNTDVNSEDQAAHVKHRHFTKWVDTNKSGWRLLEHIPNKYPGNGQSKTGSFADFFIYQTV